MRILLLTQYYHPEPVEKVHDLARGLVRLGHRVQAVTGFPCYPQGRIYEGYRQSLGRRETLDGVEILRIPQWPDHSRSALRRAAYYLSFAASAATLGLVRCGKADVLLVYQAALPIGLAAWWISRLRRIPYVLDVVDLWPESVIASGMIKNRTILALLRELARFVYRGAARISVVTEGFRRSLLESGVDDARLEVIPNWMPSDTYQRQEPDAAIAHREGMAGRFNVVYAGNMGPSQNLQTVLDAAGLLRDLPEVQFVLVGGGLEAADLERSCRERGLSNVRFLGRRPPESMPALYALADVLLVHLKPDLLSDLSIPSKTFAYMASGRPILMAVRGVAEGFMAENRCGRAVPPSDPASLAEAVGWFHALSREEREAMGETAATAYAEKYCSDVQIAKFDRLLTKAVNRETGRGRESFSRSATDVFPTSKIPSPTWKKTPDPFGSHRRPALLVTGANGFLGAEIVRQATHHRRVRAMVRTATHNQAGVNFVRADLADDDALAAAVAGIDTVIHCAGMAHKLGYQPSEQEFTQVNEIGTANLAHAAAAAGVRHLVLISSVSVYGDGGHFAKETSPCRPQDHYAQSKLRGEERTIEIAAASGMRLTILRLCALYGENDPGNLARLMRSIDAGRFVWVGAGKNLKSLMHVEDAARACLLAGRRDQGGQIEIYNLAAPPCRMREVVATLSSALGRDAPKWRIPAVLARAVFGAAVWMPVFRTRTRRWETTLRKWLRHDAFDGSRFCRDFDFWPQIDLAEGIRREVDWYRQRGQETMRRAA